RPTRRRYLRQRRKDRLTRSRQRRSGQATAFEDEAFARPFRMAHASREREASWPRLRHARLGRTGATAAKDAHTTASRGASERLASLRGYDRGSSETQVWYRRQSGTRIARRAGVSCQNLCVRHDQGCAGLAQRSRRTSAELLLLGLLELEVILGRHFAGAVGCVVTVTSLVALERE